MDTPTALFEQQVLSSLEKQKKLFHLVGTSAWNLNLGARLLSFQEGGFQFPFQLLGTQSESSGTWLWSWANKQLEAPRGVLHAALMLQEIGEEQGIETLTEPQFEVSHADGHYLSLLASGLLDASAHYRCGYQGGAAFVLVEDERIDQQPGFDFMSLTSQFTNIMSAYAFNQRNALVAYLSAHKLEHTFEGDTVRFTLANGDKGEASFDSLNRLSKLSSTLGKAS